MGYPYGKTYLEQIRENKKECELIEGAYYILINKLAEEKYGGDIDSLTLPERFAALGEAFKYASNVLDGITDDYHFMWDVLDALLLGDDDD